MVARNDDEGCPCGPENHLDRWMLHKMDQDGESRSGDDGPERNVAPDRNHDREDNQHEDNLPRGEGDEYADSGCHTFAPAEFEPNGEAVAQNRSECCCRHPRGILKSHLRSKQDRQQSFSGVQNEGGDEPHDSEIPHDVGGAD